MLLHGLFFFSFYAFSPLLPSSPSFACTLHSTWPLSDEEEIFVELCKVIQSHVPIEDVDFIDETDVVTVNLLESTIQIKEDNEEEEESCC